MKLVIVTAVDDYQEDVFQLFKNAEIDNFSESDIEGYKTTKSSPMSSNWFGTKKNSADSEMFFSFSEDKKIDVLFSLIKTFNQNLKSNNPIRAVVVPIEKYI